MVDNSSRIRNYTIVAFCIFASAIIVIGGIPFIQLQMLQLDRYQKSFEQMEKYEKPIETKLSIHADCMPSRAIVGIQSFGNGIATNVTCTAIESGLFTEDEISLGDIPPGSVDGCVFESIKPLEKMTRFEVKFNENESMKFLCTLEDHDF